MVFTSQNVPFSLYLTYCLIYVSTIRERQIKVLVGQSFLWMILYRRIKLGQPTAFITFSLTNLVSLTKLKREMPEIEIVPIKHEYEKRAYEIWYLGMSSDLNILTVEFWARKKSTWTLLTSGRLA